LCSNNERRDDFWKDIYKKIQLNSKETKYKRIHKRNKLLSLKIGEFVSTISLSKRYKKLVKRKEELTVYTNSNVFFSKSLRVRIFGSFTQQNSRSEYF
jgi:hypothetical protein